MSKFVIESKPAVGIQLLSEESPVASSNQSQEPLPVQQPAEATEAQDTLLQIKPAHTEACPFEGMANPSTKDFKAIISPTKEQSTTPVTYVDQPMEVTLLPQPSSVNLTGASFLETAPTELRKRHEIPFHITLPEAAKPSSSRTSADMDTTLENKPNLSFTSLSLEEKPIKSSVERLVEMVSSSHSSPLTRMAPLKEAPQTHILPSLDDGSGVIPPTALVPFTPKIGMGKPAITKRKFSPGRPRVKQVRSKKLI